MGPTDSLKLHRVLIKHYRVMSTGESVLLYTELMSISYTVTVH